MDVTEKIHFVLVEAADGPILVPHTQEEYDALWKGVDKEAIEALYGHEEAS